MAINLFCPECKTNLSVGTKICKNCGHRFENGRKYRVIVKDKNGKRISKVVKSISMAKKLESRLKTQVLESNLLGIQKVPKIESVWGKYLLWATDNKKSWKDDEMRWNRHIHPHLAGKKMDAITTFDVQKVIDNMKAKRDYAPATVKHVVVLIKRVYNWAIQMDLYKGDNPATRIKLPKLNNEVTECLTKEEINRLLNTLDNWSNRGAALLIEFALYTGLRRGELFSLKWDVIDMENGWKELTDTKGGKDNNLPISDKALDILQQAKECLPFPECPYVFPKRSGAKRKSIRHTWTQIKKDAKIPKKFRFHGLRHTFASYLASSGKVSQYTLQKLLTHKSSQMTQRYAHLFDQTLRDGANVMASMI